MKKQSKFYPLLFGLAFVVLSYITQSWEPAIIGAIFILVFIFLILYDVSEKRKSVPETEAPIHMAPNKTENKMNDGNVKFPQFGFWVESVSQVKTLLCYMQRAVDIALQQGYTVKDVCVYGGVHELDTGYESFSSKTYSSFEEAKQQLPIDFAEEEAELDGQWFNTMNFEFLTVHLIKDETSYSLTFARGKLHAPEELQKIYLSIDWQKEV